MQSASRFDKHQQPQLDRHREGGVTRSTLHGELVVGMGHGSHSLWSRGFLSSSLDDPVSSPTLSPWHPLVIWSWERKAVKAKFPQEYPL